MRQQQDQVKPWPWKRPAHFTALPSIKERGRSQVGVHEYPFIHYTHQFHYFNPNQSDNYKKKGEWRVFSSLSYKKKTKKNYFNRSILLFECFSGTFIIRSRLWKTLPTSRLFTRLLCLRLIVFGAIIEVKWRLTRIKLNGTSLTFGLTWIKFCPFSCFFKAISKQLNDEALLHLVLLTFVLRSMYLIGLKPLHNFNAI